MEAIYSSEMSVEFQRTTRRYIPEARTLHNHHCENLEFYKDIFFFSVTTTLRYTGLGVISPHWSGATEELHTPSA
jgi:hypothetical protein